MPDSASDPELEKALAAAHVERVTLNFSWLLKLRWAAVVGQLATILAVRVVLGVELPLVVLLAIVAVGALTNVAFVLWFRLTSRHEGWANVAVNGEAVIGLIMLLDMILLTGLLYVSGGPRNPFGLFYVVNVVLAAVVLRPLWGWVLGAVGIACYGLLFIDSIPLAALEPSASSSWNLQSRGLFVAFAVATVIILYFFTRLTKELTRIEAELVVTRKRRSRSQRMEAMATLAAGAAHELSSPLSTIAVVAKELERELEVPRDLAHAAEDARLIRSEVVRCREILDQMSADAGKSAGEPFVATTVEALVEEVLEPVGGRERVDVRMDEPTRELELVLPRRALSRALRGLIDNAVDASPPGARIDLAAWSEHGDLQVEVRDSGHGMDPATLEQVGHPFFTTKEPGKGMGLGVFLARAVVEGLGGQMELESTRGRGTAVRITIPREIRRPRAAIRG